MKLETEATDLTKGETMNRKKLGWTLGELAGVCFKLIFMGSVLLFLFLIAEDIEAIRNHQVPSDREVLMEKHNRISDVIRRGKHD